MKKLVALLVALTMVLSMTAAMAAGSPTVGDTFGTTTTGGNTNTETTALSFKKIDMTAAATALLDKLAAAKEAGGINSVIPIVGADAVVQELFSVEIDEENNNLIKTTANLTNAADLMVHLAFTAEDSADAAFDFDVAKSVEVLESGELKPVYAANTIEAAKAAATITLIITSAPIE